MSNVLSYRRNDGIVGVGFLIEYGGIEQHSIAWPDRAPERYSQSMLDVNLISSEPVTFAEQAPVEPLPPSEPDLLVDKPENDSEADWIRAYLADNPTATNAEVIEALGATGVTVTSSQVSRYRNG